MNFYCFLSIVFGFLFNTIALESKELKVLVLIISSDNDSFYKVLRESWKSYMQIDRKHFECYFLRGDDRYPSQWDRRDPEWVIQADHIYTKVHECYIPGILEKTIKSLQGMSSRLDEFDYVLRTNLSSFYIFPRLLKFLETAPRTQFYSGIPIAWGINPPGAILGIQGSGILMSTDLAKMMIDPREGLIHSPHIDDAAIAELFYRHNIPAIKGKYIEIYQVKDWNEIKNSIPEDVYHIRTKIDDRWKGDLSGDLVVRKEALKMFYNKDFAWKKRG